MTIQSVRIPTPTERFFNKYPEKKEVIEIVTNAIALALLNYDIDPRRDAIAVSFPDVFKHRKEAEVTYFQTEFIVYLHNLLYPLGWDLHRHNVWNDQLIIKPLIMGNLNDCA